VNPLTTHQHTPPTGTTSSAVDQPHHPEPTTTDQPLIRRHDLEVPVNVIAALTPPSVRQQVQLIAHHDTAARPHSRPGLTDAVWHTDLAVLAGAMHGTRTTITRDHASHHRPHSRPGRAGVQARPHTPLAEQHPRPALLIGNPS